MAAKSTGVPLFDQAAEEVAESGALSFPTRRQLWLALGEWEWREEDDPEDTPRTLAEALKKRAGLAWACAKKVMPVWSAYAPDDKTPQKLLKAVRDYLDGKIPAETLKKALEEGGFLDRAEKEPYSTAPAAAMAAWQAAWAAWLDEPLLAQRYADAIDSELDYDDWDAAYLASVAWGGRDEEAQPGERAVQRMRFWVWYLELLAPLLGIQGYKFPKKAIAVFKEKQFPVKPVPEEVSMESFCDYIGAGDYLYHTWNGSSCEIVTRMRGDHAVCPKTKEECRQLKFYYMVALLKDTLPGDHPFTVTMWEPLFHCDVHPGNSHAPRSEYANPKANCRRYLAGPKRSSGRSGSRRPMSLSSGKDTPPSTGRRSITTTSASRRGCPASAGPTGAPKRWRSTWKNSAPTSTSRIAAGRTSDGSTPTRRSPRRTAASCWSTSATGCGATPTRPESCAG